MKNIIRRLYNTVSYYRVDESLTMPDEKDFIILLNQYIFLLSVIFFLHSLLSMFFIGLVTDTFLLLGISIFFCIAFIVHRNISKNRYIISVIFILLTGIVTYYSSLCSIGSGIFLFYLPLISAISIFFSWKSHRLFIIFLILFILSNIYLSAMSNFELVERNERYISIRHTLMVLNITCVLLLSALNSYFFQQKLEDYYFTLNRNLYQTGQIENLNNELERLKKILNKDVFSEETIKDLINSMQLNDVIFIEKFESIFPDYFDKLHKHSESPLSVSDIKMSAMLKLGFTTKQIAIYTNSSIKSVEGKIYRLRKKLKISSDSESKTWFTTL